MPAVAGVQGESTGVVDQTTGIWYVRDAANGATTSFYYGNPGDYPIRSDVWGCRGVGALEQHITRTPMRRDPLRHKGSLWWALLGSNQ